MPDSQIGVLIDYENVGLGSINSLFDQLSHVGRIIIKRAYADWSKASSSSDRMLGLGIEAKHYFRATNSGKNASDICLAIDAIDLLHRSPIDTFVIVSSDTDFAPLVSALRAAGKTVIGAGHRAVVSPALVHSCDRYIYLDAGKPTAQTHSTLKGQAESLLVRAVEASTDELGQVLAAKLHNTMLRMDPSFNYKALGHRTFTHFLDSTPLVTLRRPRGRSGDVLVELTGGQTHPPAGEADKDERPSESSIPPTGESWDIEVDAAWSNIRDEPISGSKAAAEAAKVLDVPKVSSSRYKTLQGILDASEFLRTQWSRKGNTILRRTTPTQAFEINSG